MRKSICLAAVLCLAAFIAAPSAFADGVSGLSLTPSGSQTNFTITGTYTPGTPTTPFSAPNTAYSLTFSLATTPSSLAFVDTTNGLFGIDTGVMVNGVSFSNSQILFFDTGFGGGLVVCLSQACNPVTIAPNFWDIFGNQLFSGSLSNPTFISGTQTIDLVNSGYQITTPEPSSLLLLGTGLVGLIGWGRRKLLA